ncbi:hypothetical protein P4C99_15570, partial [Pontiellaceae bacterium B1224]|nr:hypothetical protein [Pontiellaceae bacterium B1224]
METKIYTCFIASPSDTKAERDACDVVFNEINQSTGKELGFRVESLRWEQDARPDNERPGRSEPRCVKRRPKPFQHMTAPREVMKE